MTFFKAIPIPWRASASVAFIQVGPFTYEVPCGWSTHSTQYEAPWEYSTKLPGGGSRSRTFLHQNKDFVMTTGNINPFKNKAVAFDQRPWPFHGRYTRTDTCVRLGVAVAITVRNGSFTSETAVRRFQK